MSTYESRRIISFGDCDPAGIVYHPRYLEMINETIEAWFAEGLGKSFAKLHLEDRKGVPSVKITTEFPAPGRLGDEITLTLRVERLGTASFDLAVEGARGGNVLVSSRLTLVYMDLESAGSEPLPDDLRSAMGRFLTSSGEDI